MPRATARYSILVDGELFFGPLGPAVRVPPTGQSTTTGEVLQWCPKNNPVRALLGSLKSNVDPIPLPVYPVKVEADGTILTSFLK